MTNTARCVSAFAVATVIASCSANLSAQVSPGPGVTMPRVLKDVQPSPKPESRVLVECVVLESGMVSSEKVVVSSNPKDDEAALSAVKQWTFAPGTKNGEPVPVRIYIELAPRRK